MPQPLTGYTIIEMGTAIQGPAAGVYLSDMGPMSSRSSRQSATQADFTEV